MIIKSRAIEEGINPLNKDEFYELAIDWLTDSPILEDIESLADYCGFTIHQLKCRFKRTFGYSIMNFIKKDDVKNE